MAGLIGSFTDLGAVTSIAAAAMADMAPKISTVADATKKLADAQRQLAVDTQFAKEQAEGHKRAMEDESTAMAALATSTASGTDSIDLYGEAVGSAQKKMSSWQPIWLTVTAATNEQNAALENLLKTQNAYSDAVKNTLDVAKGWKDYLAGLVDAYQTGAMDLLQYKNALVAFQTQLVQTFSGATGEARKAIEAMQAAIQKLIDTAGGGPQTPTGAWQNPTQQLNNIFNK